MTLPTDSLFERRLSTLLHGVLDDQAGPHPAWADAPVARRVAGGEGAPRWKFGNLRLLAIAAVLTVGGAAAAGAFLRNSPTPPLPLPTHSSLPLPTTAATNGWVAYTHGTGGQVFVKGPGGQETLIRGLGPRQSCPEFGPGGLMAMAVSDTIDRDPPQWRIVVVRILPDGSASDELSTLFINERPDENDACFEWSPNGERFAYAPLIGNDVAFTIADSNLSSNVLTVGRDHPPVIPDYVRWQPDGSAIALVYSVDPDGDGSGLYSEIWIAPSDGSAGAHLILKTDPNEIVNDVAWSPDGAAIAYRGTKFTPSGATGSFVRVLTFGAAEERLELDTVSDPQITAAAGPAWSPDGSQLAWVLGGELRVGAPDGSGWRGLPPVSSDALGLGWAYEPVIWSADGSQLMVGQLSEPNFGQDVETSAVLYDLDTNGQPTGVLPWRLGGYGRISWQVLER